VADWRNGSSQWQPPVSGPSRWESLVTDQTPPVSGPPWQAPTGGQPSWQAPTGGQVPVAGGPPPAAEWPPRAEIPRTMPTPQPRHAAPDLVMPQRRTLSGFFRRADADPRNWLLLIPIVIPLVPWIYNRIEPTFLGLPFFYWSQLGFAFLASGVIAYVHRKVR
jgi:hypothetical protein